MARSLAYSRLLKDANLKMYYPFLGGSLGMVNDLSNQKCPLVNNNGVGLAPGPIGIQVAADFGAANTNKYLKTASANLPAFGASNVSWFMWIKLEAEITANSYYVFDYHSGISNGLYQNIWYNYNSGTRVLCFEVGKEGVGPFANKQYTVTLGTTNWYHIGYTFNGSTVTGYFNGSSIGTASGSGGGTTTTSKQLLLGWNSALNSGLNFRGLIADFMCFDRILTGAEITDLYSGKFKGGIIVPQINVN